MRILTQLGVSCLCAIAALTFLWSSPASAQGLTTTDKRIKTTSGISESTDLGFRNGSVVVAPIPFSNPMIGSGLAIGAGYLFKTAPDANTSLIGIGGLKSDNGSQAAGLVFNLATSENRWLFKSFFGTADVNYDLYLPGTSIFIPIRQEGTLARASLAYGVTPEISLGGQIRYLETNVSPEFGFLPPSLQPDLGLELMQVGLVADWDRRDNSDYPAKGFRLAFQGNRGAEVGGTRSYVQSSLMFDIFHSFGPNTVLAARGALCGVSDDAPFFDKCSLGGSDSFRGFNASRYLDNRLTSVQAELRQRIGKRFGLVAFAGAGWVGQEFSQLNSGGPHAAGGIGLRYRVSKKFPVDFSVDVSRNDLGGDLVYIYVGQRF